MTRRERDEVMRCVGRLEGMLALISPVEGEYEEDSKILIDGISEVTLRLESVVRGIDPYDISDFLAKTITKPCENCEGGDDDDV